MSLTKLNAICHTTFKSNFPVLKSSFSFIATAMEKAFHIATQRNATQLAVPIRLEVGRCEEKEKTEMEGGRPGGQAAREKERGRAAFPEAQLFWNGSSFL